MRVKVFILLILSSELLHASDTLFRQPVVLKRMQHVADWQLNYWKEKGPRHPWWDWTNAAGYTGIIALSKISKDQKYLHALVSIGDTLNWQTGPHRFHADDYCIGQTYSLLYAKYKDKKMIAKFRQLA